jgi:hypothetical protein
MLNVTRIFPAEIVYQVKGWSKEEFEILKAGTIEEYLLSILDFDLLFITPADFSEFVVNVWDFTRPIDGCHVDPDVIRLFKNNTKRLELLTRQYL